MKLFLYIILLYFSFAAYADKGLSVTASKNAVSSSYRKLHAICIGINRYNNPQIPALSYAENDAVQFAEILRRKYGFTNIELLLGSNATKENIENAIAGLQDTDKITSQDGIIFYFSGHAITVSNNRREQGFILPVDAQVELNNISNPVMFRKTAIRMDELKLDGDYIPAKHVLFIIDACCSGYMAMKSVTPAVSVENALRYPARQVLTAGGKGENAVEHNIWKHGAFSYKLFQKLENTLKPVSASELGVWLKHTVPNLVRSQFPNMTLSPQSKYLSGEGDFCFIPNKLGMTSPAVMETASNAPPPSVLDDMRHYWDHGQYVKITNRFISKGKNKIYDKHLKRTWIIIPNKIFNYQMAVDYIKKFHPAYRLPSTEELNTLQIKYPEKDDWKINHNYFPANERASKFWTSDSSGFWDGSNPCYVDFISGKNDSCSEEFYNAILIISRDSQAE